VWKKYIIEMERFILTKRYPIEDMKMRHTLDIIPIVGVGGGFIENL